MAIFVKNKEITSINAKNKVITSVYKGVQLVWEAIRSCFGKGHWINNYPWSNEDAWKSNI